MSQEAIIKFLKKNKKEFTSEEISKALGIALQNVSKQLTRLLKDPESIKEVSCRIPNWEEQREKLGFKRPNARVRIYYHISLKKGFCPIWFFETKVGYIFIKRSFQ